MFYLSAAGVLYCMLGLDLFFYLFIYFFKLLMIVVLLYVFQYFISHHHYNANGKNSLASQFSQLTNKIWCGRYSSLRPTDFKDAFGQQWRDFRDYRQVSN